VKKEGMGRSGFNTPKNAFLRSPAPEEIATGVLVDLTDHYGRVSVACEKV
jgi:hypothetical protein